MVDKITNPPSQKGVIDKINEVIDNIPTVNNATLTITQGGVQKGTFTANASSNVTIDLDAGGGSDINLVGVAPITVTETQAGGAVNIDTSNGYIKGTYNNISSSYTVASYTATLQNSSISTSPSTVKEFFTGSVSYFDVPTDFGQRASNASGSLVSDVVRLSGYSSLNSNYNPMILWGYLDAQGEFTPVIYCKAYGAGEVVGYINSVSNASTNTLNLVMAAAETSTTSTSSSQATGYDFTISLKTNGNMSARYDRYTGSTDYYNSRDLIPTATPSIYTNFLKINVARVFLRGNSTNSYLPTVNDTKLIKDGVTTSWKVTDTSVAGTSIGINIDSTPTSASNNAITSGGVYTALGNKQNATLYAEPNVTTFSEISIALANGKDVVVIDEDNSNDKVYYNLVYADTSSEFIFSAIVDDTAECTGMSIRVDNQDSWTTYNINLQNKLVSGTNIKTINSTPLLGSGDISVLQNTATGTDSLTIGGTASTYSYNVNIGNGSVASNLYGVAIGRNAKSQQTYAIAIGADAEATNSTSIQIGNGTNNTASTLSIGFGSSGNYQLLDGTTGLIPDARISTNIARTSQIQPGLPSQTGHSGDVLTTDGTDASWADTATVYPVVEVSPENILPAWYRIYAPDSTGYRWCEMGNLYYKGSTVAGDNTINFLKNFKDLNYGFTPTPLHSTANLNQYQMYEKYPDRTVSSVNLHVTSAVFGYAWTACGYIANEV